MVNYTPKLAEMPNPDRLLHSVDDLMTCNFISFREEMDIEEAVKSLLKHDYSSAPVINQQGYLVGMLSEKDCLKLATEIRYHNTHLGHVRDYMTTNVSTIGEGANIFNVIDRFLAEGFKTYPVVTFDGVVVGVVTRKQALKFVSGLRQTTW